MLMLLAAAAAPARGARYRRVTLLTRARCRRAIADALLCLFSCDAALMLMFMILRRMVGYRYTVGIP